MINYLVKLWYSGVVAFFFSRIIAGLMFEPSTSYNIVFYGLGVVLTPVYYRRLSTIFATKVVLLEKDAFAKELERQLKEKVDG